MRLRILDNINEMHQIIHRCEVCNVAMADGQGNPYVLPFNFGFDGEYIYLHSGPEGKKMDILAKNPRVCLSFSTDHQLAWQHEEVACSHFMRYRSVLVTGKVEFITEEDKKREALNIMMRKYVGREFPYNLPALRNVAVYRVRIAEITGKVMGYH